MRMAINGKAGLHIPANFGAFVRHLDAAARTERRKAAPRFWGPGVQTNGGYKPAPLRIEPAATCTARELKALLKKFKDLGE
jgi:hypothetical protein